MNKKSENHLVKALVGGLLLCGFISTAEASHYRRAHRPVPFNICDLIPPNDQNISVDPADNTSKVDQRTFESILHALETVYAPIVAQAGGRLQINHLWDNDEANANATRSPDGRDWIINMYGGLARHPDITPDAFLLVGCHEMGHQLGGAPYKTRAGWRAAAEGQSDYFGTLKCMRMVLKQFNNSKIVSQLGPEVTPEIVKGCQIASKEQEKVAVCVRSVIAGQHLATALRNLINEDQKAQNRPPLPPISLGTPDRSQVPVTLFNAYPSIQCRLDTYAAGALCPVPAEIPIRTDDTVSGQCTLPTVNSFQGNSMVFALGARPACWFRQF